MQCEKLFEEIDNLYPKYLKVWEDVCNIESPTNYKEGVDKVAEYFKNMAEKLSWKVEVLKQKVAGDVLVITANENSDEKPVCFSGHSDTVHPIGLFGSPAVKMDKEKIYGPGVMDCKGGIVASFMAMEALIKCGYKKRPLMLLIQSDEEVGSSISHKETINYNCEKTKDAIAFFNTEGQVKGTAVIERKGILRYRFEVSGVALHSARCAEAASAIRDASYKIIELEKIKDAKGLTCNCGLISGGSAANIVAAKCTFMADIRFVNEQELNEVREKVNEIAEKVYVEGCSTEFEEISFRPAMEKCEKNVKLLDKMNEKYMECGMEQLKPRVNLRGSDAAYTTLSGIPTVDCVGVEGKNIHSKDEFAYLASLKTSAKNLAAVTYMI